jgi:hypothetical protein
MKPSFKQKLEEHYTALGKHCELPMTRWLPTEENLRWLLRYAARHPNGKYREIEALAKQLVSYRPKTWSDTEEDLQAVLKGNK